MLILLECQASLGLKDKPIVLNLNNGDIVVQL